MGFAVFRESNNTLQTGFAPLSPEFLVTGSVFGSADWLLVERDANNRLTPGEIVDVFELDFLGNVDLASQRVGQYRGLVDLNGDLVLESVVVDLPFGEEIFTDLSRFIAFQPFSTRVAVFPRDFLLAPGTPVQPPANSPPLAIDDAFFWPAGAAVIAVPALNDVDGDGDFLSVVSTSGAVGGITSIIPGLGVHFVPFPGFTGTASFQYLVTDGNGGIDAGLVEIEFVSPPDGAPSLANAQTILYLYEVGLNRDGNFDVEGLDFWIRANEEGLSLQEIARLFLGSAEFASSVGDPEGFSDREFVETLYFNVLGRAGEGAGVAFWESALAADGYGREDLLVDFARSPENRIGTPAAAVLTRDQETGNWDFLVDPDLLV